MGEVRLPPTAAGGEPSVFSARSVSALDVTRRFRRSVLALEPLFGESDVISVRIGTTAWHIGRSPEWARLVIGSRSLWADVDIVPLGLGGHSDYYAMGGLPGAPPERHRVARRTAAGCFREQVDPASIEDAIALGTRLAARDGSTIDVYAFTRILFLRLTSSAIMGLDLAEEEVLQILGWFDRWTAIMSNPLVVVGQPALPFTPAGRLRQVLAPWYAYLAGLIHNGAEAPGLVEALRHRVTDGMPEQEAIGYLATVMFAGTEPPAHTLMWAYAHCVAAGAGDHGPVDAQRAEAFMWESVRVRPAVNLVVRRVSASAREYKSKSSDTYVVAPPLAHRRTNQRRGLPQDFTLPTGTAARLDPDEYPGLGCGAHHCLGARFGMDTGRDALRYLLDHASVLRQPDLSPSGVITSQPRRLPTIVI